MDDIAGQPGAGPSEGGASLYRSSASSVPRERWGMAMPPWLVVGFTSPKFDGCMSKVVGRKDLGRKFVLHPKVGR